jgi:hypothetical protein
VLHGFDAARSAGVVIGISGVYKQSNMLLIGLRGEIKEILRIPPSELTTGLLYVAKIMHSLKSRASLDCRWFILYVLPREYVYASFSAASKYPYALIAGNHQLPRNSPATLSGCTSRTMYPADRNSPTISRREK